MLNENCAVPVIKDVIRQNFVKLQLHKTKILQLHKILWSITIATIATNYNFPILLAVLLNSMSTSFPGHHQNN